MLVSPGDIVLGDDDGVVVVPIAMAEEVARAAAAYLAGENAKRARLREAYLPFGAEEELRERGYRFDRRAARSGGEATQEEERGSERDTSRGD